jgi:type IV secretion system protein VirB9
MKFFKITAIAAVTLIFFACATAHFDKVNEVEPAPAAESVETLDEEIAADEKELEQFAIEEELKTIDVEQTVIYIDRPIYSPVEEKPPEPKLKGEEAVKASTEGALQVPIRFVNGMMFYPYDETFVYEIYCQPYRVTDIMLEPGEEVLEMPFLSEDKVWEIGAGVSRKNNVDVQHFFAKPSISGLVTSMIIITDKRVYHILLRSYKDRYMTMVSWEYPRNILPFHVKETAMDERARRINGRETAADTIDPAFLSFDYKMTYSLFKKPLWLPRRVYDDGRKTYIELDEKMLHAESPALFNHKNERINYRVQKNLVIIDELIEKVTLRRGKEKVTIVKKRYKEIDGTDPVHFEY